MRHKSKKALKLVKTARRLRDLFKIFSVVPKAKILFGFYQVAGARVRVRFRVRVGVRVRFRVRGRVRVRVS